MKDCATCRWHLGGGSCRINLESECGEGEHEAWEAKGDDDQSGGDGDERKG